MTTSKQTKTRSTLFNILHYVQLVLAVLISLVLRILPAKLARRLYFTADVFIQMINLAAGRLLPELKPQRRDLSGPVAIVTGANSGIGLQLAVEFAQQNATVVLACRNESKFQQAVNHVLWSAPQSKGRVRCMKLDTSSLDSVREFALAWSEREHSRIDILCHNAGIASTHAGEEDALTSDGIDKIYATNFLGSFLLTHFLEPYLAPDARVILTSSTGQLSGKFSPRFAKGPVRGVIEPGFHTGQSSIFGWKISAAYSSAPRYSNSKAMQVAFARLLQRRFDNVAASKGQNLNRRRTAHSFTPGFTSTPIFGKVEYGSVFSDPIFVILKLTTWLATDVDQGAATGLWLATTDDPQVIGHGHGGDYWDRMTKRYSSVDRLSESTLMRMWTRWENDAGIEWIV